MQHRYNCNATTNSINSDATTDCMKNTIVIVCCLLCCVAGALAATVDIDWGEEQSVVRNTFYGVNNHGTWASGNTLIDANGDGTDDAQSDYAWHRQKMLEANVRYLRADMYLDGASPTAPHFAGRVNTARGMVEWAYNHKITMLYIVSYMPYAMANITQDCQQSPSRCGPKDNQAFANLVVEWLDEVTLNGTYADAIELEVWNEPDLAGFWLPSITNRTDHRIFDIYNAMYGPIYDTVKARYPGMVVGGPGLASIKNEGGKQFAQAWLAQHRGKQDFVSFHYYSNSQPFDEDLVAVFGNATLRCTEAGATCRRFLLDEFNDGDVYQKQANSANFGRQIALAYAYMLRWNASMISTALYQWSESNKYLPNIGYPEYPQRWSMVSEPLLDNAVYRSFDVLKAISSTHVPGAVVVAATSDDDDVVVIASRHNSNGAITVINKGAVAKSLVITGVQEEGSIGIDEVQQFSVELQAQPVEPPPEQPEQPPVQESEQPPPASQQEQTNDTEQQSEQSDPQPAEQQTEHVGYNSTYDMNDMEPIITDGIGTFAAAVVDNIELLVLCAVLLVGVWVARKSK
jgi:hypothetical protein